MTYEDAMEYEDRHALNRDRKAAKRLGMVVTNRSMKSVLLPTLLKKSRQSRGKGGRNAR